MRSGYKIIDDQVRIKGQFYIDSKLSEFEIRPDFIVVKNRRAKELKINEQNKTIN